MKEDDLLAREASRAFLYEVWEDLEDMEQREMLLAAMLAVSEQEPQKDN